MAEKLAIGISGTLGAPIAIALLKGLRRSDVGTHLVISGGGKLTIDQETRYKLEEMERLAGTVYNSQDLGTSPTSGSFKILRTAMVPCNMKTLAGIHSGYSDSLLLRATDVTMKGRRELVLVTREYPLSPIHLRNVYELSQVGAIILPPMMSYYQGPGTIGEMTAHAMGKITDQFSPEYQSFRHQER